MGHCYRNVVVLAFGIATSLSGACRDFNVRIDTGTAEPTDKPHIDVNGADATPIWDPGFNGWRVPLQKTGRFVTPVDILATGALIHAVRLEVPVSLIRSDQSIYLDVSKPFTVDEPKVREIWSNNGITSRASNLRVQFKYLQLTLFMAKDIYGSDKHAPSSAMKAAVSLMLVQVVSNLANSTWYVVDPDSERVVTSAIEYLRGLGSRKACGWLGHPACDGLERLLDKVDSAPRIRIRRIWKSELPPGSITVSVCTDAKVSELKSFWEYVEAVGDSASPALRASIAADIASCVMVNTMCVTQETARRLVNLRYVIDTLGGLSDGTSQYKQYDARIAETQATLAGLEAGQPAVCTRVASS